MDFAFFRKSMHDGDPRKAWSVFSSLLSEDEDSAKAYLRRIVCVGHWFLAGELFTLEGKLGWGPGHRDWDGDGLPPRTKAAANRLCGFVFDIASIPPDNRTLNLANALAKGTDKTLLECRTFNYINNKASVVYERRRDRMTAIASFLYDRIVEQKSVYEIGAARIFYLVDEAFPSYVAMAGLLLILVRGISSISALSKAAFGRMDFMALHDERFAKKCEAVYA